MSKCVDMEYQCEQCSRAHQAHKPWQGRLDTSICRGTSCPVCCGEYWTRLRVRLHLKFSKRCQAMIAYGGVPELPDDEVQRLDAKDLTQRRDNVAAERHLHFAARGPLPGFLVARM